MPILPSTKPLHLKFESILAGCRVDLGLDPQIKRFVGLFVSADIACILLGVPRVVSSKQEFEAFGSQVT